MHKDLYDFIDETKQLFGGDADELFSTLMTFCILSAYRSKIKRHDAKTVTDILYIAVCSDGNIRIQLQKSIAEGIEEAKEIRQSAVFFKALKEAEEEIEAIVQQEKGA